MRRPVCIVLWTVCFAIIILSAWLMTWNWLMREGIATVWAQDFVDQLQLIAYSTYVAMPLLGLILGLFGKLPGTKPFKNETLK